MRDPEADAESMDDLPSWVHLLAATAGVLLERRELEEIADVVRDKPDQRAAVVEELRRRNLLPARKEDWMRW